jgi:hypothetical protein
MRNSTYTLPSNKVCNVTVDRLPHKAGTLLAPSVDSDTADVSRLVLVRVFYGRSIRDCEVRHHPT